MEELRGRKRSDKMDSIKFNQVDLEEHIQELQNDLESSHGLFSIRTANQCLIDASKRPIPKKLFDEFWFEGEINILFSDTNLGKSILAVQIADSITKGVPINGFDFEAKPHKVLLFDFELSDKQFENRYSKDYSDHYRFDSKLYRIEIDPRSEIPENDVEESISRDIERAIIEQKAKIIIIDNITYLKDELDKAKGALPLMKQLKALKEKHNLSILVLSHTPKRDPYKPLGRNDLQGSRMLLNFCDSSFAIGQSFSDNNLRYLKQIKVRNCQHQYTTEKICICEIAKPGNMVQFEFRRYGYESDHLKQRNKMQMEKIKAEAAKLNEKGMTKVAIAKRFEVSEGAVRKWLK